MLIFIKLNKWLNNTIQTVIKIQVEIPNLPETSICYNVYITWRSVLMFVRAQMSTGTFVWTAEDLLPGWVSWLCAAGSVAVGPVEGDKVLL